MKFIEANKKPRFCETPYIKGIKYTHWKPNKFLETKLNIAIAELQQTVVRWCKQNESFFVSELIRFLMDILNILFIYGVLQKQGFFVFIGMLLNLVSSCGI